MISALKRLVTTNDNNNGSNSKDSSNGNVAATSSNQNLNNISPSNNSAISSNISAAFLNNGMQMISQSLQKKFSKGVNCNMKIVIRGDCNVGKTCLWLRLQGQPFKEAYETSDEIKVANIQWNYSKTDDIVKVEIWDVVDRSKKKRNLLQQQRIQSVNSLKLENSSNLDPSKIPVEASLDAEFIDVYKNANGCIMVYDITKQWTWEYIERELPKIPTHIPVLIIGNHRDMHHHRSVDELKCKFFLENLNRGSLGSEVRYTETSMRTGFGLKYLYKFFNIPFLQLQRENLMQQLETNAKEMDNICEELAGLEEKIEDDYDLFSQNLNSKRRQQQEENAKDILKNAVSIDEARRIAQEKEAQAAALAAAQAAQESEPKKVINNIINKINTKVAQTLPAAPTPLSMSVTLNQDSKKKLPIPQSQSSISIGGKNTSNPLSFKVEEISSSLVDDELNKFLSDSSKPNSSSTNGINQINNGSKQNLNKNDDDDDDDDSYKGNNPMVAAFKETIDSSDEDEKKSKENNVKIKSVPIELSDEEEPTEEVINEEKNDYKENLNLKPSNNEFIFLNTSHSSQGSFKINDEKQDGSGSKKLDNFSTTSSILNIDQTSQLSSLNPPLITNDIKLSSDDFEFLEKMSQKNPNDTVKKKDKEEKKSSKKSSKKKSDDEGETKTSKKKSSKSSKNKDESTDFMVDLASDSSTSKKKEKKKSSKSSSSKSTSKSSKTNLNYDRYDDDDSDSYPGNVVIKKDIDYEEL